MITQEGKNTFAAGIYGNFDDAQTGVKHLFSSESTQAKIAERGYIFSSANSINIGRLLPQVVYYFWAYAQMVTMGSIVKGEKINFTVPTGNFGNILAGYYAMKMGLPVNRLICASNENKILSDFFTSGTYDANRDFHTTISPSMDILISSNLERLLFDLSDATSVKTAMRHLSDDKVYDFAYKTDTIVGCSAPSEDALKAIGEMYNKGYLMDTHTAVGFAAYDKYMQVARDTTKNVFLATASPYKFPEDVLRGLGKETAKGGFDAVKLLSEYTGTEVPDCIKHLHKKDILHETVCQKNEMEAVILDFLKKQGE
jgi:threonine synthase